MFRSAGKIIWAAPLAALLLFLAMPLTSSEASPKDARRSGFQGNGNTLFLNEPAESSVLTTDIDWVGRLKPGKRLSLNDLDNFSAVLDNKTIITKKDIKKWEAWLNNECLVIEAQRVGLDKPKNYYQQNVFSNFKNVYVELPKECISGWTARLQNDLLITDKKTGKWSGKLNQRTRIIKGQCPGKTKELIYRSEIDIDDLDIILKKHKLWLDNPDEKNGEKICLNGADVYKVNLSGAKLRLSSFRNVNMYEANLANADLERAGIFDVDLQYSELREAKLFGANLSRVKMKKADLRNSYLSYAKLDNVDLEQAKLHDAEMQKTTLASGNLNEAVLINADLRRATLYNVTMLETDLRNADMRYATLCNVTMLETTLKGAKLHGADLSHTVFEKIKHLPPTLNMLHVKNLWQLVFNDHSYSLEQLKAEFKKNGLPTYARQVNHAIKHNKGGVSWHSYVTYYLLEWPSDWGASPLRPLFLLLFFVLFFSCFYFLALDGWSGYEVYIIDDTEEKPFRPKGWPFIGYAILLSFISSLRFGWKGIEKGTWLTDALPKEILLKPVGWCRAVCGLQSVISKYLILLCLLNYFGGLFKD